MRKRTTAEKIGEALFPSFSRRSVQREAGYLTLAAALVYDTAFLTLAVICAGWLAFFQGKIPAIGHDWLTLFLVHLLPSVFAVRITLMLIRESIPLVRGALVDVLMLPFDIRKDIEVRRRQRQSKVRREIRNLRQHAYN